jgi:hypothetical protein
MRRNFDFLDHRDRLDRNRDFDRDSNDARFFWIIVGTWIVGSSLFVVALLHLA